MSGFGGKGARVEGDLARWGVPPHEGPLPTVNDAGEAFNPHIDTLPHCKLVDLVEYPLPLMPVHLDWLKEAVVKYGFNDVGETVRHLIFVANSEPKGNKKLIFKIKRCLHCHVGARYNQHRKVSPEGTVQVFRFQRDWLEAVVKHCRIKSSDKAVRIVCDYYMSKINVSVVCVRVSARCRAPRTCCPPCVNKIQVRPSSGARRDQTSRIGRPF